MDHDLIKNGILKIKIKISNNNDNNINNKNDKDLYHDRVQQH